MGEICFAIAYRRSPPISSFTKLPAPALRTGRGRRGRGNPIRQQCSIHLNYLDRLKWIGGLLLLRRSVGLDAMNLGESL